jgi:hypothetical protein
MHSRWYTIAVVVLWLASMGWLVGKKLLPALWVGDPPEARSILAARQDESVVGWIIVCNSERTGWALNSIKPTASGMTRAHSRVHFEDMLRLSRSLPTWLGKAFDQIRGHLPAQLEMDLENESEFDTLGRLSNFLSVVRFPPVDDPAIKVRGTIDGAQMQLLIRSGEFNHEAQVAAPRNSMLNDALSPQTRLPGLREGQTWTVEVYSPLQTFNPNNPKDPREILLATVEAREAVVWEGRHTLAWVVVYRSDSATAANQSAKPVGKVWVLRDGLVVKQQILFFGSTVTFYRLTEAQALSLAGQVQYRP